MGTKDNGERAERGREAEAINMKNCDPDAMRRRMMQIKMTKTATETAMRRNALRMEPHSSILFFN